MHRGDGYVDDDDDDDDDGNGDQSGPRWLSCSSIQESTTKKPASTYSFAIMLLGLPPLKFSCLACLKKMSLSRHASLRINLQMRISIWSSQIPAAIR